METDINGQMDKNGDEITVYRHDKEGQMVRVSDLVTALFHRYDKTAKLDLIEKIIADECFIGAAANLLSGHSDNEWSSWGNDIDGTKYVADTLREALLPSANAGAVQLVAHLRKQCLALQQAVKDRDEYIKELKGQWPPSFEKYQPKPVNTYAPFEHLHDHQITKLIELVAANGV